MAKITRRSYRRRRIVLGVAVFAGVALISTGLAVFALTTNASSTTTGNFDVGAASDSPLNITLGFKDDSKNSFYFEPVPGYDYIYPSGTNDVENLSVTIEGTVGSISHLDKLSIVFEPHQGVNNAVNGNYIVAPECYDNEVFIFDKANNATITADTGNDGVFLNPNDPDTYIFRYTITFAWGETYNYLNPAEYYQGTIDEAYTVGTREGIQATDEAKETLERMRAAFVDYKYDENDLLSSRTLSGYSASYYSQLTDEEKVSIPIADYVLTVYGYAD